MGAITSVLERVTFEDDILAVQAMAVQLLGRLGDRRAIDARAKLVEEHPLSEVRRRAVDLSQQLTPSSAPALYDVVTNRKAELARGDEVQRDFSPGYSRPDSP